MKLEKHLIHLIPDECRRGIVEDFVNKRYPFYGFLDLTPDACNTRSPVGLICTRKTGHQGPHVGHHYQKVPISVWGNLGDEEEESLRVWLRLLD